MKAVAIRRRNSFASGHRLFDPGRDGVVGVFESFDVGRAVGRTSGGSGTVATNPPPSLSSSGSITIESRGLSILASCLDGIDVGYQRTYINWLDRVALWDSQDCVH
jgi:hypothetical protein